jgi:hypothetical protein
MSYNFNQKTEVVLKTFRPTPAQKLAGTLEKVEITNLRTNRKGDFKFYGYNHNGVGSIAAYPFIKTNGSFKRRPNPSSNLIQSEAVLKKAGEIGCTSVRMYFPNTPEAYTDETRIPKSQAVIEATIGTKGIRRFKGIGALNIILPAAYCTITPLYPAIYTGENDEPILKPLFDAVTKKLVNVAILDSGNIITAPTSFEVKNGAIVVATILAANFDMSTNNNVRRCAIVATGSGYEYNGANEGYVNVFSTESSYWYGGFNGANVDNSNYSKPIIVARIDDQRSNISFSNTASYDDFSNTVLQSQTNSIGQIKDYMMLDTGDFMPPENYTNFHNLNVLSGNGKAVAYGELVAPTYNYEGFKTKEKVTTTAQIKEVDNEHFFKEVEICYKNGILPLFTSYFTWQSWNSGDENGNPDLALQAWNEDQHNQRAITWVKKIIDRFGFCAYSDRNEYNLDYVISDNYTGTLKYWVDLTAQAITPANKILNQNRALKVADNTLKAIKQALEQDGTLDKFYGGSTVAWSEVDNTTILVNAMNTGLLDNHDFVGCNYYGHGSIGAPMINKVGYDSMAGYTTGVTAAKKKPVIITECGLGNSYIDVTASNAIVPTLTLQATSRTNMLNALNTTYSTIVQGALIFCLSLQENRDESYLVEYPSFTPIAKDAASIGVGVADTRWSETSMGDLDLLLTGLDQHGTLNITPANITTNPAWTATQVFLSTLNPIRI